MAASPRPHPVRPHGSGPRRPDSRWHRETISTHVVLSNTRSEYVLRFRVLLPTIHADRNRYVVYGIYCSRMAGYEEVSSEGQGPRSDKESWSENYRNKLQLASRFLIMNAMPRSTDYIAVCVRERASETLVTGLTFVTHSSPVTCQLLRSCKAVAV